MAAAIEARFGPPESGAAAAGHGASGAAARLAGARRDLTRRDRLRGLVSLRCADAPGGDVSESTYSLFQQGRRTCGQGMAAQATVSLEKAKRREPDKASIREALGIAYFRIRRWREAEAEFRRVLELSPVNDYAHYALGRCLEKQGRDARGEHALQARELAAAGVGPVPRAHPRARLGSALDESRGATRVAGPGRPGWRDRTRPVRPPRRGPRRWGGAGGAARGQDRAAADLPRRGRAVRPLGGRCRRLGHSSSRSSR